MVITFVIADMGPVGVHLHSLVLLSCPFQQAEINLTKTSACRSLKPWSVTVFYKCLGSAYDGHLQWRRLQNTDKGFVVSEHGTMVKASGCE